MRTAKQYLCIYTTWSSFETTMVDGAHALLITASFREIPRR